MSSSLNQKLLGPLSPKALFWFVSFVGWFKWREVHPNLKLSGYHKLCETRLLYFVSVYRVVKSSLCCSKSPEYLKRSFWPFLLWFFTIFKILLFFKLTYVCKDSFIIYFKFWFLIKKSICNYCGIVIIYLLIFFCGNKGIFILRLNTFFIYLFSNLQKQHLFWFQIPQNKQQRIFNLRHFVYCI